MLVYLGKWWIRVRQINHKGRGKKTEVYRVCQLLAGAYDGEKDAAGAHDLAALKYWGPTTPLNFPVCVIFFHLPLLLF